MSPTKRLRIFAGPNGSGDAIKLADKSFIFDNSYSEPKLFAISNNDELEIIDTEFIPSWFQTNVLSKLESSNP